MSVTFNTSIPTFKAGIPQEECEHKACPTCGQPIKPSADSFSKVDSPKNTKTRLKDGFINLRKIFVDFGYAALGAIKGGIYGAAAGFATAGVIAVRNIVKKAPKILGIGGKILAGTVGLTVLAGNLIKSKLDANEEKAKLDHRWETGHNE